MMTDQTQEQIVKDLHRYNFMSGQLKKSLNMDYVIKFWKFHKVSDTQL